MLILDDYNQNHLNKGLVSIQDVPKKADLPSYYDPNLPCVNAPTDESQGTLQSYPFTLQGAPRRLTKAKQDTINSIMKDRSQTTSNKVKSVTDSDMFALIPIKKSINTQIGEGLTEFSGPIQVNERIYFGPVDIDRMRIRLITDKGDTLNLNGNDWSFCMIAEVTLSILISNVYVYESLLSDRILGPYLLLVSTSFCINNINMNILKYIYFFLL